MVLVYRNNISGTYFTMRSASNKGRNGSAVVLHSYIMFLGLEVYVWRTLYLCAFTFMHRCYMFCKKFKLHKNNEINDFEILSKILFLWSLHGKIQYGSALFSEKVILSREGECTFLAS